MIVITTPTGQVGHHALSRYLAAGCRPRVVARDPSRLPEAVREQVDIFEGSHGDPAVLDAALDGASGLLLVVPPLFTAADVQAHYVSYARVAADSIRKHAVGRVVAVSTLGSGLVANAGHLTAALRMDDVLREAGSAYRSLANPFFMENILAQLPRIHAEGVFSLPSDADRPLPLVATADIGAAAARLLLDETWQGQDRLPVISPDRLTPTQIAATVGESLGRTVVFEQAPLDDYKRMLLGLGASESTAQSIVDMAAAENRGFYDEEWRAAGATAPTSLLQWCEAVLRPAAAALRDA
jgi:uncharacterized protein YbjT (DUF2867 family)